MVDKASEEIGIIGLGEMGFPIATSFLEGGWSVTAFDINEDLLDKFEQRGGTIADSPAEVSTQSDSVHIIVVNEEQVSEVLFGTDGIIQGFEDEGIIVIHSTLLPSTIVGFAERSTDKIDILDAPVSGGPQRAAEGNLTVMVGGPESVVSQYLSSFEPIAKDTFHMGPTGSGMVTKLANNAIFYAGAAATLEAMELADRFDIGQERLIEVLQQGSAENFFIRNFDYFTKDRLYDEESGVYNNPNIATRMGKKDLHSFLTTAKESNTPVPISAVVSQRYPDQLIRVIEERIASSDNDDQI